MWHHQYKQTLRIYVILELAHRNQKSPFTATSLSAHYLTTTTMTNHKTKYTKCSDCNRWKKRSAIIKHLNRCSKNKHQHRRPVKRHRSRNSIMSLLEVCPHEHVCRLRITLTLVIIGFRRGIYHYHPIKATYIHLQQYIDER